MKITVLRRMMFCILLISSIFVSCNENDLDGTHTAPQRIDIHLDGDLILAKNGISTFEFSVMPENASFKHDLLKADCQIRLETASAAVGTGKLPTYYRLSNVTSADQGKNRYVATVKDFGSGMRYYDPVVLRISVTDKKGNESFIYSEPFNVMADKTPYFAEISFLKQHNETAVYEDIKINVEKKDNSYASPLISSPVLVASFESRGAKLYVDGVEQISGETANDFSKPVRYDVKGRSEYSFTVQINHSGLPVVFIETAGGKAIPSKWEDWLSGSSVTIYNKDWTIDYKGSTGIRGRGNSTWSYPKKPYALKLDSKASILGMPKHKRWVLLANWMDRTLLRNCVSFKLATMTDLAYTPRGQFVEVFINGKHNGNYFLCEHIKVDENRVNIDELDDDETDGGYIMELDTYYDEVNKFKSAVRQLPYMFKDPDEVNGAQFNFMRDYVNNMERSLYDDKRFAAREYTDYIDVDSFVDWWIVMELTGIWEPNHPKSTYMHKDKGGKLTMGPVWDFDWETYMPQNWFRINESLYYKRLFQDPVFVSAVKERWRKFKPEFMTLPEFIREEAAKIKASEDMNHQMWPIRANVIGSFINGDETMTFEDAVERMISSYEDKLNWMDKQIDRL